MNGYLTIDLEGRNFGDSEQTPLDGLYNKVKKATKPVVFFNYKIGDNASPGIPFYAGILAPTSGGVIVATIYNSSSETVIPVVVNENDTISIVTE